MLGKSLTHRMISTLSIAIVSFLISGCLVKRGPNPADPYEKYNRKVFKMNQVVDEQVYQPMARGYNKVIPGGIRKAITNFFNNLDEPITIANSFLQNNPKGVLNASKRFAINSTVGFAGLVDIASQLNIKRSPTDMGITFARWGDRNPPFIVIPFLGPSTIRDSYGITFDYTIFSPIAYIKPRECAYATMALYYLSFRANLLESEPLLKSVIIDPYAFQRDAFLQRRNFLLKVSEARTTIANMSTADPLAADAKFDDDPLPADIGDETTATTTKVTAKSD